MYDETLAPQDRDLARRDPATAEAMRDLAVAFRTSAEAIEGVRSLQGDLVRALKRQDKSELVLRSTEALNESFRNLGKVQQALLDRLERDKRSGPGRLIPLMLIALLAVFLGGIYAVVLLVEQVQVERQDGATLVEQATAKALEAYRDGTEVGHAAYAAEVERLTAENEQVRQRAEALLKRADEANVAQADVLREKRQLEGEIEGLSQRVLTMQNQLLAKQVLEEEATAQAARIAVLEPRLQDLEARLEAERQESLGLKKRLAAIGLGRPDPEAPDDAEEEAAPEPEARPEPAPADPRPRVERQPALLAKVQGRLNQILRQGAGEQDTYWQVQKVGGMTDRGLVNVVVSVYGRANNQLLQEMNAEDVRFYVNLGERSAHMEIRGGTYRDAKGLHDVPAEGMSYRIATGEMHRLWSESGLLFVKTR